VTRVPALLLALVVAGCATTSGRPHSSPAAFFDSHLSSAAWRDDVVRDYLTAPPVIVPAALVAGAVAVSPWDRELQGSFQGRLGNEPRIGNLSVAVLLVGSVTLGVAAPGPGRTEWDELWNQAEALGTSAIVTEVLKSATHRKRPGSSSSHASFPSGHASAGFAAATLIERNSGLGFGLPAYGLAALAAFSRVESGRHFPSDVLAGAAIGTLSAGVFDALHFGTGREAKGISASPISLEAVSLADGGLAVALSIQF
jgi:hypothetical protein